MPRLRLQNLTKRYGAGPLVLNGITLDLEPGRLTALIGKNGVGKSTLLGLIQGQLEPTEGSVVYKEQILSQDPVRARQLISLMPQFHLPLRGVKVREALEAIGLIRGLHPDKSRKKAEEFIQVFRLEQFASKKAEDISGGIWRLVSLGMAVIGSGPILLLDEPTNDVDPDRRQLLWKYLKRLSDSGKIVVVVSHNQLEVEQFADRLLLLEDGMIQERSVELSPSYQGILKIGVDDRQLSFSKRLEKTDLDFLGEFFLVKEPYQLDELFKILRQAILDGELNEVYLKGGGEDG